MPPARAPAPVRLLLLGGTSFLGPAVVRCARERGHEVTLFHRGRTNPGLFPELESLRGDRNGDVSALAEGRGAGAFNAVGFDRRVTLGELIEAGVRAIGGDARPTPVPAPVLARLGITPWQHLPAWLPPEGNSPVSNERAVAAGLRFRPLEATFRDTLAWVRATGRAPAWGEHGVPGLSVATEDAALAAAAAAASASRPGDQRQP